MNEEAGPDPSAKLHPAPQTQKEGRTVVRGGAPLALAGAAALLALGLILRHSPNPSLPQPPKQQAAASIAAPAQPSVPASQPGTIPPMSDADLQAVPSAGGSAYLNIGPRISEDPAEGDEVVFGCVFNTAFDNYRVIGDAIDVVIDGKKNRIPFQASGIYPGAIKAIARVPGLAGKHTVVFLPTYDLGKDGTAAVKIISSSDGMGGKTTAFESAVDREDGSGQARPLRLK